MLNLEVFVWPGTVIVIAVIAMLLFRKSFERFLDRVKKIGKTRNLRSRRCARDRKVRSRPIRCR